MISEIKSRINCVEYAQRFGLPIRKEGDRTTSLSGGNNNTALVVFSDFWHDFKLSQGGDVIDLCAIARYDGDRKKAIADLAKITGVENEMHDDWINYTQNLNNKIQKWHESLRQQDIDYLHSRGIKDETIQRLKIGQASGRLTIPYFKNGYVAYYISRGNNPKYKKAKIDGCNENVPWGLHSIKEDNNTLVISEGAFDAISFEQEGYSVLATMGGHFSREQLKSVRDICKQFEQVFVCFDNDDAGADFTVAFSKFLFQNKISFIAGELPPKYKDISEYYQDGGNLQELIDNAQNGLIGLCKRITDKEEFKQFSYKSARFMGKPELVELFNAASKQFPPDWFEQVKKSAMSPPSEDIIAKEIISKHKLKYIEALGFFEYQRGAWKKKNDTQIQSYIGDELGHYRTGGRISSILKLLKADCITTDLFDKKPLFNFINGTLDLTTYEFREHRESDLCSMQVSYAYDKTIYSAKWDNFIAEICADDPKRIALLQEIAGYILFPDCSLQKCFFLMGEGANGKSVYLDILSAVFGEDNTSNIEMSGLVEPFQRIQLISSILNVSSETKTDVKGAESIFKQVVVGDRINGCYKNKDFIDFRSRAKLLFACNELINAKDISYGFVRRICFVKFENKFVDNPSGPKELKKDNEITKKLMEDLPAIFNWALEGYIILKSTKEFTQTDDEQTSIQEFMEMTNPIHVFIKEADLPDRITNNELYEEYRSWCIASGHMPKSRTGFIRAFKSAKPNNIIEFNTAGIRGFYVNKSVAGKVLQFEPIK